jgi:hypothetical protein
MQSDSLSLLEKEMLNMIDKENELKVSNMDLTNKAKI